MKTHRIFPLSLSLALGLILFLPSFSYADDIAAVSLDASVSSPPDVSASSSTDSSTIILPVLDDAATTSPDDSIVASSDPTILLLDDASSTASTTATTVGDTDETSTSSVQIQISPNLIKEYEAFESVASSSMGIALISADDQALLSSEITGVTPDRLLGLKLSMLMMLVHSPRWPRYLPHFSHRTGQYANQFADIVHQIVTMTSGKDFPVLDKKIHDKIFI